MDAYRVSFSFAAGVVSRGGCRVYPHRTYRSGEDGGSHLQRLENQARLIIAWDPERIDWANTLPSTPLHPFDWSCDRRHSPRALEVARIGRRLFAEGKTVDPFRLEPVYLRRSAAEEKRDRT